MTTKEQFLKWKTQGFNWIPIISEIIGDLETPLTLYLKLANNPYTYLLESGFNGEHWGRYSFLGLRASFRIVINENQVSYFQEDTLTQEFYSKDPLKKIEEIFNRYKVPPLENYPRFMGGFVGYFGYDTIRYIEPKLNQFKQKNSLEVPDIFLMLSNEYIVYDNLTNKIFIIVYVSPENKDAYENALHKINTIKQKIKLSQPQAEHFYTPSQSDFISNMSKEVYEEGVRKAIEYFKAGDAMQLILSQRFSKQFEGSPIAFYRTLRHLNPSPYMFYLHFSDFHIVGASPEILVRLENNQVTVRPLAGTRKRGKTRKEDKQLEQDLLNDAKEIAEHLMLIDLGRNDIGKICEIGSVLVSEQMIVERFSHVMHISSTVTGEVKPTLTSLDILRATFPAGTVSGAPKIRAMEIIDELEEEKRGIYGGAIGYLGWNGNLDMAITLRTAVIKNNKIYIQAGAGLVADSIPSLEWQECINKAKALFLATEKIKNLLIE